MSELSFFKFFDMTKFFRFPFTFSLPEEGFKKLVDSGIQTGPTSACSDKCNDSKGRNGQCLLSTEFAAAFGRRGDQMFYIVHIGEEFK